jgi:hypothetical protein
MEEASLRKIKVPAKLAASLSVSDTFILVPAKNVLVEEEEEEEEGEKMKKEASCLQRDWEEMVEFLENEIESSFPFKRWIHAKNLLRELLRCSDLCISADYRLCFIKNQSASKQKHFSIVDFLNLATRHSAPGEMLSQKMLDFVPLVRILLAHAIPHTYIPNKILLQQALAHGGRVKKHVHK